MPVFILWAVPTVFVIGGALISVFDCEHLRSL